VEEPSNPSPRDVPGRTEEPELSPEELYPGVRPEVSLALAEIRRRERALWREVERETAEFNRPRGIMGKLFGLRTSVG
jgi:hypothetical protein